MTDYSRYANEKVFDLPQEMQDKILDLLTCWHNTALDYWQRSRHAENSDARDYCDSYYKLYTTKIKNCKEMLNVMDIHPVIGWIGHRNRYFFPTVWDCEMQEDWDFQCSDD